MKVVFDKSFSKSIEKLGNRKIKTKITDFIVKLEAAGSLEEIPSVKKMTGFTVYFRAKIGDYRIGMELQKDEVRLITVAHRKDIYKRFP